MTKSKISASVCNVSEGKKFKAYLSMIGKDSSYIIWLESLEEASALERELVFASKLIQQAIDDVENSDSSQTFTDNQRLAFGMEALERASEKFSGEGFNWEGK